MDPPQSPNRGNRKSRRTTAVHISEERTHARHPSSAPSQEYRSSRWDRRDRSSSPARNRGRESSGSWNDKDREFRTRAPPYFNSYRPSYENENSPPLRRPSISSNEPDRRNLPQRSTTDSPPRSPPSRPFLGHNDIPDNTTSVSGANSIPLKIKKDLIVAPSTLNSLPTQPPKLAKIRDSNFIQPATNPHLHAATPEIIISHSSEIITNETSREQISADNDSRRSHQVNGMAVPESYAPNVRAAVDTMTQILLQFFEEATDLATLKDQKAAAKRDLDKKDQEFKNGEENHEKFPAMKETQIRSKDSAQKTFRSIELKYAEKDAKLKGVLRQGATHLVLSGLGSSEHERQELKAKFEVLDHTTKSLQQKLQIQQTKLEDHQAYIEKQRTEREAVESQNHKLQNELASLRNSYDSFVTESKPRINEVQRTAVKLISDLNAINQNHARVENSILELSASLPENLKVAFPELSTRVANLSSMMPDNLKVIFSTLLTQVTALSAVVPENLKSTLADFSKRIDILASLYKQESITNMQKITEEHRSNAVSQTLETYSKRLLKLEHQVKGDLASLSTHITTMIRDQKQLREDFGTSQSIIEHLLGKVAALESQDHTTSLAETRNKINDFSDVVESFKARLSSIPSNVDLVDLRKKLALSESAAVRIDQLSDTTEGLKMRIEVVEKQPPSNPDRQASTPAEAIYARLAAIETRLADMEKQAHNGSDVTLPSGSGNALNSVDLRSNIEEQRLQHLETRLSELAKNSWPRLKLDHPHSLAFAQELDYDRLKSDIIAVVESMQSGSDAAMGGMIDELSSKVQQLKDYVDQLPDVFIPVASLVQVNNRLDEFSKKIASVTQHETQVNNRLDDFSAKVITLTEHEQSNGDILRQIEEKYTQWAGVQSNMLSTLSNQLSAIDSDLQERVEAVTHGIFSINTRLDGIYTKDMAMHILNQMDSTYPNLRNAERTLEQHRISLQKIEARFQGIDMTMTPLLARIPAEEIATTQALREALDGLTSQVINAKGLAKEAKDAIDHLAKEVEKNVPDQIAGLRVDLGDLKDWRDLELQKAQVKDVPRKAAMSPAIELATSVSYSSVGNSIRGHSKRDLPASRHSSDEPISKKRRENGPQLPAAPKSNGLHSSPGRKRRRFNVNDIPDDVEDADFEPAPPTISDDDE